VVYRFRSAEGNGIAGPKALGSLSPGQRPGGVDAVLAVFGPTGQSFLLPCSEEWLARWAEPVTWRPPSQGVALG
jgi:hypothetical protein